MKTIRCKMNETQSGRHAGFTATGQFHCLFGHEYDVPADLAEHWLRDGVATKATKRKVKEPTDE